ncbi:hypothetical protein ALNOE001_05490 [Candidatus Methanobinarius endosymbioticus]|uniref:Uncharacterized protein n=1 Tax=Candidatus Methanobinarius endosymbioticus TaxID=2006182 RepID=A0A366MCP0_9EURY|nr:hypothetical protein ALNOE001_05490 [Candidatus Methanobinarius endosymbioticus]
MADENNGPSNKELEEVREKYGATATDDISKTDNAAKSDKTDKKDSNIVDDIQKVGVDTVNKAEEFVGESIGKAETLYKDQKDEKGNNSRTFEIIIEIILIIAGLIIIWNPSIIGWVIGLVLVIYGLLKIINLLR